MPNLYIISGCNGSGKTTFCGKLALNLKSKRGMKVLVAACDTFRPAAIEQLKMLCGQIQVECYSEDGVKDPIRIAQNAIRKAKAEGYSVVVIDTAGRLAVDQELMDEISALHKAVKPTETLFVVDANEEKNAIKEANVLNIPVFAMVDTNVDPTPIKYVIPSNDDSIKATQLILGYVTEAIKEGKK